MIEPEDLGPRRVETNRNLGTDPYQTQERIMGDYYPNPIAEDMDEFGKVGVEMSYIHSQMHSDYDSPESIADSDFEDGELRKLLASPLYIQGREDHESSRRPTASGKPEAVRMQKRGASAQRIQADHSRRESLMSSSSQEPRAYGKLDAMFSSRSHELGSQYDNSFFKFAYPSNLGRSLLDGNRDHLLTQARSELMKQGHKVGSLNNCIGDLQPQAYAQRLESQDAQHGFVESRREQVRLQEELIVYERKSSPRHSDPK